jgi:Zn-dependent peptidase ImmA (M78 family)/DNA-binding XRE family transcriptional regulator
MLKWAREKSGYDLIGAAKRINNIKPEKLKEWEEGIRKPTIKQALKMAEVYRRPLSAFYLNEPPVGVTIAIKDFRTLPDVTQKYFSPALLMEHRSAIARRDLFLELIENESVGTFPKLGSISLRDDPEQVGQEIRKLLKFDWTIQKKMTNKRDALNWLKESVERLNILVFHTYHLGIKLDIEEARGFSISEERYPVIVLNSQDATTGRIFTLMHELVHLMLNEGGVCDCRDRTVDGIVNEVEIFCNHAAGAALVPLEILNEQNIVKTHIRTGKGHKWEDFDIESLASDFSVSNETLLRRLLVSGLTSRQFYLSKRDEYRERWELSREKTGEKKKKRSPPFYRMKIRQLGIPFTRTVITAYYERRITLSDLLDYIGIKSKSLKEIESAAFMIPKGT